MYWVAIAPFDSTIKWNRAICPAKKFFCMAITAVKSDMLKLVYPAVRPRLCSR